MMRMDIIRSGLLAGSSAVVSVLLLGFIPCQGFAESALQIVQQFSQAGDMAGYVLNAETNMNRTYSRQLQQQLFPSPNAEQDEPVIEFKGPPTPAWEQPNFLLSTPKPGALPHITRP